jgi:hypothetical protein
MKALATYQSVFLGYEEQKLQGLEKEMQFPFFSNLSKNIDKYLKDIDRDDVITELQSKKKSGSSIKVKDWSPLKSEGFHSLFLEKHILYRYAAYDENGFSNMSKLYETEKTATKDRLKMIEDVANFMPSWTES